MGTREPVLVDSGGGFPFLPLLLMVITGIIGITIWLTWMLLKSKNKKEMEVTPAATPPAVTASADPYLLGLQRSPSGEWDIRINGQRYRSLDAVPDAAVRKEVVAGLRELVTFSRDYIQKERDAQSPSRSPQKAPQSTPTSKPKSEASPATSPPPPSPSPQVTQPPPKKPKEAPRLRLSGEPVLKRSNAPATLMPTIDLAQEIGDLVEEMQAHAPQLRDRSIRLRNAASGGIEFTIDGIVYGAIDEIPDQDIQALIRAAIKEWEHR